MQKRKYLTVLGLLLLFLLIAFAGMGTALIHDKSGANLLITFMIITGFSLPATAVARKLLYSL